MAENETNQWMAGQKVMIEYNYPEDGVYIDTLSHFCYSCVFSPQIIIHTSNSHIGNTRTRHAN